MAIPTREPSIPHGEANAFFIGNIMNVLMNIDMINALIVGLAMVTANLGARFLMLDMNKKRENLLSHPNMRYLYVFCMGFVSTRSYLLAGVVAMIYSVFILLTNEA